MKRYVRCSTEINNSQLYALAEDLLYQCWDNNRYEDYGKSDAIECVFDHMKLVITQMDEDGNYAEYKDIFKDSEKKFDSMIRKVAKIVVENHFDEYEWE